MTCNRKKAWKTFQQGDSFGFPMLHKINKQLVDIEDGYNLGIGFIDEFGRTLHVAKIGSGITRLDVGTYIVEVTHEVSVNMVGYVTLEFVIYDSEDRIVDHSTDMAVLYFEPRQMNENI